MGYNGSGLFQINTAGQPVVADTVIDPTVFNALTADLATGLSTAITKDGQTTVTANIPMATYKFTGLGAGSARTDSASLANVQDGTGVYVGTVGGTADVITLTPSPAIASYTAGQTFRFIASGANTTSVTVNVSGLGAKAITKNGTTALAAGDIPSGMMVEITYDGTRFILESPAARLSFPDNLFTVEGSADATKKMQFEVDGITTATTRTVTMPDANVDLTLVRAATTSVSGVAELATTAEVQTGTDTARVPSVDSLRNGLLVVSGPTATTSGTNVDFSPSAWAKRVVLLLNGFSVSGSNTPFIQLGDAGGIETSGYTGASSAIGHGVATTCVAIGAAVGFPITNAGANGNTYYGRIVLELADSATNTWVLSSVLAETSTPKQEICAGIKALSATLTTVRLSCSSTFDAGAVTALFE